MMSVVAYIWKQRNLLRSHAQGVGKATLSQAILPLKDLEIPILEMPLT